MERGLRDGAEGGLRDGREWWERAEGLRGGRGNERQGAAAGSNVVLNQSINQPDLLVMGAHVMCMCVVSQGGARDRRRRVEEEDRGRRGRPCVR